MPFYSYITKQMTCLYYIHADIPNVFCPLATFPHQFSFVILVNLFVICFQHDTTVSALLQSMQLYNNRMIPYTSSVIWELYSTNTSDDMSEHRNTYYVKVLFRNESDHHPYQLQLPGQLY